MDLSNSYKVGIQKTYAALQNKKITINHKKLIPSAVESTKFQIFSAFVAAIFASFAAIYAADSVAPLMIYLQPLMNLSDSMVGWISSIVFLPSLFMGVLLSPLIDKFGAIYSGLLIIAVNACVGAIVPFSIKNEYIFLAVRFLSGLVDEPSWIVQAKIITQFIPHRFESIAFGTCMAVSTSASIVGYLTIPVIMGDSQIGQEDFNSKLNLCLWMTTIISLACLVIFFVFCIPLKMSERKKHIEPISDNEDDALLFSNQQQLDNAEDNEKKEEIATSTSSQKNGEDTQLNEKRQSKFKFSIEYWLINVNFAVLVSCSYGSQTMLIVYLDQFVGNAGVFGILRAIGCIASGPLTGLLVKQTGLRPMWTMICQVLGIFSFIIMLFPHQIALLYIAMCLLGWLDGASAAVAKSLFVYVMNENQETLGYALSGVTMNVLSFTLPPIAGFAALINWPVGQAGTIWFYSLIMVFGLVASIILMFRDKITFKRELSVKPK